MEKKNESIAIDLDNSLDYIKMQENWMEKPDDQNDKKVAYTLDAKTEGVTYACLLLASCVLKKNHQPSNLKVSDHCHTT